jgi:hypothetical protein
VPPRAPQTTATASAPVLQRQVAAPPAPPRIATVVERPVPLGRPAPVARSASGSLFSSIYAPAHTPTNVRAAASPNEATGAITTARAVPAAKPHIVSHPAHIVAPGAIRPKQAETKQPQTAAQQSKPAIDERASNAASLVANTASSAAPMAPAGNFESRWSSITARGRF